MPFIFLGCDPTSQMEANIENLTSRNVSIEFVSANPDLNKILQVASGQSELFQEGFDVGSTFLEPSLVEYDSIVVKNQSGVILKIYQENDMGKNIYNVNEHWKASEPSKRFFHYEYEILNEDLE